jgi:hypothetical protein
MLGEEGGMWDEGRKGTHVVEFVSFGLLLEVGGVEASLAKDGVCSDGDGYWLEAGIASSHALNASCDAFDVLSPRVLRL